MTITEIYENVFKAVKTLETERKTKVPIIISQGLVDMPNPEGTIKFQDMTSDNIDSSALVKNKHFNLEDIVVLPYSSGTTGLPKGVQLSHRNLITNCLQIQSEPKICTARKASGKFYL